MKFKLLLAIVVIASCITPTAHAAETGWRYWGYFQAAPGANKWTAAMTGRRRIKKVQSYCHS